MPRREQYICPAGQISQKPFHVDVFIRSRSVEKAQTWNGDRSWSSFWRGRVCQVCRKSADLERGGTTESALLGVNDEEPQKAYVNGCVHTAIA